MTRLASKFWIQAYLARLQLANIQGFVVVHGDDSSGAVLVKINYLNGYAGIYQRSYDLMNEKRCWISLFDGDENKANEVIARQRSSDPDIWVVEVEDKLRRHLLNEEGLE
ncbi:MAG: DUF1491 family protein [Aestuariivita sp.]|nr:DUF1491 family protein [Aestuariivita sp.]